MIIDNTHVRGMFIYNETSEYERGDFVIEGNTIYICTAKNPNNQLNNTVSGILPSTDSDNFDTYLLDKTSTFKEYLEEVKNNFEEDKLISGSVLSEILSNYSFGYDEKGIIKDFISYTPETGITFSPGIEKILEGTTKDGSILDSILKSPDINNAFIRISRSIPEISIKLPVIDTDGSVEGVDIDSIVLRQYTYYSSTNKETYRVQEIADHISGNVLYRYAFGKNYAISSVWKNSFVNNKFKEEVQYVKNYYENKIIELEKLKDSLIGNFRYRELAINKSEEVTLQCNNPNGENYIRCSDFSKPIIITVVVQTSTDGIIFRNNSVTIDLSDSIVTSGGILEYYIGGDSTNTIKVLNPTKTSITLKLSGRSSRFVNIYYRDNYIKEL